MNPWELKDLEFFGKKKKNIVALGITVKGPEPVSVQVSLVIRRWYVPIVWNLETLVFFGTQNCKNVYYKGRLC